jgi:hypothetical protein
MNRTARLVGLLLAIAFVGSLLGGSGRVAAHEPVTVGEYQLLVGWRQEPAIAGVLNGLDLQILNGTMAPVLGAEHTFNATLSTGPASLVKALEPQFGRDGWYTFDVIPTRPGAYSVRLRGFLGMPIVTTVDVNVTLDDVGVAADLAFPDPDPTARELQAQINTANAAMAALQAQLALALGLAVLGLIVGGIGLAAARRMAKAPRKEQ